MPALGPFFLFIRHERGPVFRSLRRCRPQKRAARCLFSRTPPVLKKFKTKWAAGAIPSADRVRPVRSGLAQRLDRRIFSDATFSEHSCISFRPKNGSSRSRRPTGCVSEGVYSCEYSDRLLAPFTLFCLGRDLDIAVKLKDVLPDFGPSAKFQRGLGILVNAAEFLERIAVAIASFPPLPSFFKLRLIIINFKLEIGSPSQP